MEFERAYVRDIISPNEYEFYCNKFIVHFKTMDHVHPLLYDLFGSFKMFTILPPHFEGKTKMKEWIGSLSAADEFDLESCYNSFMASPPNVGT